MQVTSKPFLIIGGDGTIGSALAQRLQEQGHEFLATTRRSTDTHRIFFDLAEEPSTWPRLPKAEVAFLCAASTKLDTCEDNPEATRLINVTHMQALTEQLQAQGSFVIFLSSNQVFDGSKPHRKADEPTSPLNEYGQQKAELEGWLLSRAQPAAVLRLTKVITGPLPILSKWEETLKDEKTVEAYEDLAFSPLPLDSVLDGLTHIAQTRQPGIYQLSGKTQLSYYDIAQKLAKNLGFEASSVKPVSALTAGIRPQFLPRYGTLDTSTMKNIDIPETDCLENL